jgi:thioredoxin 1
MGDIKVMRFGAEWCKFCKVYDRNFYKAVGDLGVSYQEVDIDKESDTAQQFNVTNIPETIIFRGGEIVDRFVGAVSSRRLSESIQNASGALV